MNTKQFDQWNKDKKILHYGQRTPRVRSREIWWCYLGINIGDEQDGSGEQFLRPVLILRVFNEHLAFIIPATSATKDSPYYFPITLRDRPGSLILTQARLISTSRLHDRMIEDRITQELFLNIREAFRALF